MDLALEPASFNPISEKFAVVIPNARSGNAAAIKQRVESLFS